MPVLLHMLHWNVNNLYKERFNFNIEFMLYIAGQISRNIKQHIILRRIISPNMFIAPSTVRCVSPKTYALTHPGFKDQGRWNKCHFVRRSGRWEAIMSWNIMWRSADHDADLENSWSYLRTGSKSGRRSGNWYRWSVIHRRFWQASIIATDYR